MSLQIAARERDVILTYHSKEDEARCGGRDRSDGAPRCRSATRRADRACLAFSPRTQHPAHLWHIVGRTSTRKPGGGSNLVNRGSHRPAATVRRIYDTNFFGALSVLQAFVPLLEKSPAPRVVNVASEIGSLTNISNLDWFAYGVTLSAIVPEKPRSTR